MYLDGTDSQGLLGADGAHLTDGVPFTSLVVTDTIISQYQNAPALTQLIANLSAYINPAANIDDFYNKIWNVATAVGYGLDVWGRIVGVNRVIQVANNPYFGFDEATTASANPFNQAPFYSGQTVTSNFALTDDAFRTLIYAKALANISNGSIPSINAILMILFGAYGACYCTDGGNMTMTYTFQFILSPVQAAIVATGVIPRPAGVALSIVQV